VYNLKYTPTTLGVQSWREITFGGTRTKRVVYCCSKYLTVLLHYNERSVGYKYIQVCSYNYKVTNYIMLRAEVKLHL
jgi:hypothetical protein